MSFPFSAPDAFTYPAQPPAEQDVRDAVLEVRRLQGRIMALEEAGEMPGPFSQGPISRRAAWVMEDLASAKAEVLRIALEAF